MAVAVSTPPELVEEILLNLPVKSLVRFSTVLRSWNSIISNPRFIGKHRSLTGRERILISHSAQGSLNPCSTLPLSFITSNHTPMPLICPFTSSATTHLLASCVDLWCVEHDDSLFLWNPSITTYKKLPPPSIHLQNPLHCNDYMFRYHFSFGIGYDSLADDYKILKLRCHHIHNHTSSSSYDELYSLRSDSWRKIPTFPTQVDQSGKGVFTSGALHWVGYPHSASSLHEAVIISFNFSTDKWAEVAQPPQIRSDHDNRAMKLSDIRGKLCLHLNYHQKRRYVLWAMQESNCSWIKMLDIDYCSFDPYPKASACLTALYFYDNGKILIKSTAEEYPTTLKFIDEDGEESIIEYSCMYDEYTSGHLYVESLVSPANYCSRQHPPPTANRSFLVPRRSSFLLYYFVSVLCSIFLEWKEKLAYVCGFQLFR